MTNKVETPATGDTIFVCCKLPHGLIMELITPSPAGETGYSRPAPPGRRVKIPGANSLRPEGMVGNPAALAYTITPVDRAFAEEWFRRNKDLKFVEDGSVFTKDTIAQAMGEKKEREEAKGGNEIRTGFEPADPDNPGVPGVTADKEHLKKLRRRSATTFTV